jgi:hypothetical protein
MPTNASFELKGCALESQYTVKLENSHSLCSMVAVNKLSVSLAVSASELRADAVVIALQL